MHRSTVQRTLFIELVLKRMIDECASLSKIWRAEAVLYNSCGLNSSAMKSLVNIARTTSCRTVHSQPAPREMCAATYAAYHLTRSVRTFHRLVSRDILGLQPLWAGRQAARSGDKCSRWLASAEQQDSLTRHACISH